MNEDVFFVFLDLPCSVEGITKINYDGTYTVIINSNLSLEKQMKAIKHELQHVKNNDCYRECENALDLEMRII